MAATPSVLEAARKRLAKLDLPPEVAEMYLLGSSRKGKRFVLVMHMKDGSSKKVHFGAKGADTWLDHSDPVRRANFHTRFRSTIAASKSFTPMWLAANLLW